MGKVISLSEVVDANKELERADVPCKVHLRDACGRQTLWLEPAGDNLKAAVAAGQSFVRAFFEAKGYELEFDPVEGINFWAK